MNSENGKRLALVFHPGQGELYLQLIIPQFPRTASADPGRDATSEDLSAETHETGVRILVLHVA
jgi:hypothetical protein